MKDRSIRAIESIIMDSVKTVRLKFPAFSPVIFVGKSLFVDSQTYTVNTMYPFKCGCIHTRYYLPVQEPMRHFQDNDDSDHSIRRPSLSIHNTHIGYGSAGAISIKGKQIQPADPKGLQKLNNFFMRVIAFALIYLMLLQPESLKGQCPNKGFFLWNRMAFLQKSSIPYADQLKEYLKSDSLWKICSPHPDSLSVYPR